MPMIFLGRRFRARNSSRMCRLSALSCWGGSGILAAVATLGLVHAAKCADNLSIVIGAVEYTRDSNLDEEGRAALENYMQFALSRLGYGKVQLLSEYLHGCKQKLQPTDANASCPFPDFILQIQVTERHG